jgi:hypothetical protein
LRVHGTCPTLTDQSQYDNVTHQAFTDRLRPVFAGADAVLIAEDSSLAVSADKRLPKSTSDHLRVASPVTQKKLGQSFLTGCTTSI